MSLYDLEKYMAYLIQLIAIIFELISNMPIYFILKVL